MLFHVEEGYWNSCIPSGRRMVKLFGFKWKEDDPIYLCGSEARWGTCRKFNGKNVYFIWEEDGEIILCKVEGWEWNWFVPSIWRILNLLYSNWKEDIEIVLFQLKGGYWNCFIPSRRRVMQWLYFNWKEGSAIVIFQLEGGLKLFYCKWEEEG